MTTFESMIVTGLVALILAAMSLLFAILVTASGSDDDGNDLPPLAW